MLGCDSKLFKYGNAASCNVGIDFLSAYAWRRVFTWQHNAIKNGPPSLSLFFFFFIRSLISVVFPLLLN